jgi:copper resistance protein C
MAHRSIPLAAAGAALAALTAVAGPALSASAHNTVIAVSPDGESTVTEQPGTVWLETNDALLDAEGSTAMDVIGPDGRHYATDCASVSGAVASVSAELGATGEYTVVWRVVSADGHPISGDFAFDWEPADGEPVADGATEAVCETATASGDPAGAGDEQGTSGGAATDLAWIAGAGIAVLAAAGVALLFLRRRPGSDEVAGDATLSDEGGGSGADGAGAPGAPGASGDGPHPDREPPATG